MAEFPTKNPQLSPWDAFAQSMPSSVIQPGLTTKLSDKLGAIGQKKAAVDQAASIKKAAFGDRNDLQDIAAAAYNGNALSLNPVIQDMRTMDYGTLVQKYGKEVADQSWRLYQAEFDFNQDLERERSFGEQVTDSGLSVLAGLSGTVGSAAALAVAGANKLSPWKEPGDRLTAAIVEGTEAISGSLRDLQTPEQQARREARERINRQNQEDNRIQAETEMEDGSSPTFANLRRIGRDSLAGLSNLADDPAMAADVIAEGLGSLGPSSLAAKQAVRLAGKSALKEFAVPTAIGLTESAGSLSSAMSEVLRMSPDELMQGSETYRTLRDSGMSHEEAQLRVANETGLGAAARQFPVAALAGKVAEKFELAPIASSTSIRTALGNIGRETVEEGIQSGTGEMSSNAAIQANADDSRDLAQGVGQATASGIVGGAGMAGSLQVPGAAGQALARGAGALGSVAGKAIDSRLKSVDAAIDSTAATGENAVTAATDTARQAASRLNESLTTRIAEKAAQTPSQEVPETPQPNVEEQTQAQLVGSLFLNAEEGNATPERVRKLFLGEDSMTEGSDVFRPDVLNEVVREIDSGAHDEQTVKEGALWLRAQADRLDALQDMDLMGLAQEQLELIQEARAAIQTIRSNPKLTKALETAETVSQADLGPLPEVTADNLTSPEVQDGIRQTALLAQTNPAGIDVRFATAILNQKAAGLIDLSDRTAKQIEAAKAIAETLARAAAEKQALADAITLTDGKTTIEGKTRKQVTEEVLESGNQEGKSVFGRLGLKGHLAQIAGSLAAGNKALAQEQVDNLKGFAEHMQRKVAAANESLEINQPNGNAVKYSVWTGTKVRKPNQDDKGVYVYSGSKNSLLTGKAIVSDAKLVSDIYESLLKSFPDLLVGEPIKRTEPDSRIALSATEQDADISIEDLVPTEEKAPVRERRIRKDAKVIIKNSLIEEEADAEDARRKKSHAAPGKAKKAKGTGRGTKKGTGTAGTETPADETGSGQPPAGGASGNTGEPDARDAASGLTQKEVKDRLERMMKETGKKFRPLDPETYQKVMAAVKAVAPKLGLDPAMIQFVALQESDRYVGRAFWATGELTLSQKVIDKLDSYQGQVVLLHELGHFYDWAARTDQTMASQTADRLNYKKDGDLYQEIIQAVKKNEKLKNELRYALNFPDPVIRAQELFAHLQSLYALRPEPLKELLPNVTGFFDEIRARTDKRRGSGTRFSDDGGLADGDQDTDETGTEAREKRLIEVENLYKTPSGLSRFARAYKLDAARSLLMTAANPARMFLDVLKDWANSPIAKSLSYLVSDQQRKDLSNLVEREGAHIVNAMNARLKLKTIRGGKYSLLEAISPAVQAQENNLRIEDFRELRAVNAIDPVTGQYAPQLVQAAALAGIHWAMNNSTPYNQDLEDVAKANGVSEDNVHPNMIAAANFGLGGNLAKESLAQTIKEFWGVSVNKDAPMSDIDGIAQALAVEVLVAMKNRLITEKEFPLDGDKTLVSIAPMHDSTRKEVEALSHARSLIRDLMIPEAEQAYYFDDNLPKATRQGQKGNPLSRFGSRMRKALKRHQDIVFYRNTDYLTLMQAMGQDFYKELLGFQKITEDMNRNHVLSIEGKNNNLSSAWNGVMDYNSKLEAYAAAQGKKPEEVQTRFNWFATKVERIHAEGFNPQSDKTMREVSVATVSTLDMTTDKGQELFWLTVAQSSGLVKTEKVLRAVGIAKAQTEMESKYGKAIQVFEEILTTKAKMTAEQKQVLREAFGSDAVEAKLLHAITAVARLNLARKAGGEALTQFRHLLSLEADGKTDGPINAMIHFLTGPFQARQIQLLRKGGFYPNERGKTLNQHYLADDKDLYQTGADLFTKALTSLGQTLKNFPEVQGNFNALTRLMNALGEDFQFDGQTITVGRNSLKNPLTVTVYGAGIRGIAAKVSMALLDVLYAKMTALEELRKTNPGARLQDLPGLEGYEDIEADLRLLTTTRVIESKQKRKWFHFDTITDFNTNNRRKVFAPNFSNAKGFTLYRDQLEMLRSNLIALYVKPMDQAIDSLMGETKATMKTMMAATQIQSIVLRHLFRKTVTEHLKEMRAKGELGKQDFLSQKDYEAIYKKLAKFGAIIEPIDSDQNHLNLGISDREQGIEEFSRGLQNEYGGFASMPHPSHAGVKVAPLLTISRGDAMMMVNYFIGQDPDLRVLPVFDGLEMPADGIEEISQKINQAVTEAWLENPAKDVADSFSDWFRQGKESPLTYLSELSKEDQKAVEKSLKSLDPAPQDGDSVAGLVLTLRDQLNEIALEIQARKNALKRLGFSSDHMASGESPYTHEGEFFDDLDDAQLVAKMNQFYSEELQKLAPKTDRKAVEQPNNQFWNRVIAYANRQKGAAVYTMDSKTLKAVMADASISSDNRAVFEMLRKLVPDFTFVFGSPEDLTAYRNGISPELAEMDPVALGQVDMLNRRVYVGNPTGETVLHETLHAVLQGLLLQFYQDPAQLSSEQQDALSNLESLMAQFQDMNFLQEDSSTQLVASTVQTQIDVALSQAAVSGDRAPWFRSVALGEFISWSLSNQNLIDVMRKSKVRTPLRRLVYETLKLFRRLFGFDASQKLDMFSNIAANTAVLLSAESLPSFPGSQAGRLLNQSLGLSTSSGLEWMLQNFETRIAAHLQTLPTMDSSLEGSSIRVLADKALAKFQSHGFTFDPQQEIAFKTFQAAFASTMDMDPAALLKVQDLFIHVTKQLPDDGFLVDLKKDVDYDREGRSNLLASFLALSQIHPDFRQVLESIPLPKDRQIDTSSTDALLGSTAESLMNSLSSLLSGQGRDSRTTRQALDRLTSRLAEIESDNRTWIEQQSTGLLDRADHRGAKFINKLGNKLVDYGDREVAQWQQEHRQKTRKILGQTAQLIGGVLSTTRGPDVANALTSILNNNRKAPRLIMELWNEIRGMTAENEAIYSLVNKAKYAVSAMRQDFRETTPKFLAEQFKRKLSKTEWSQMHQGFGKTDLSIWVGVKTLEKIREMFGDPRKRQSETKDLEEQLKALAADRSDYDFYRAKARDLARYMVKGEIASANHRFLSNAVAIARKLGERDMDANPAEELTETIDRLTSLYALEELDPETLKSLSSLVQEEAEGTDFILSYMGALRQAEMEKVRQSDLALLNHYKGYLPSDIQDGSSLIVRDDSEEKKLRYMGYTRLGTYEGSGAEGGKRGYYYSSVAGRNSYAQGVMQTVHVSASGVDPLTGRSTNGSTAGVITGKFVTTLTRRLAGAPSQNSTGEPLRPVFDAEGSIIAYERHMAPERLAALGRNTHLGEMLGAWAGRQAEESLAGDMNRNLVKEAHRRWLEDKATGRTAEYVQLSDPTLKDPIYIDTWNMIPKDMKAEIKAVFGKDGFMVRKEMFNNMLGYREASVADAWTDLTRLDPRSQKMLVKTATALFGESAFKKLVTAEKAWQSGISMAKQTIVIRSIIVPLSNLASNFLQLSLNGVGIRDIYRGMTTKLLEIEHYLKNAQRDVELNALLARHQDNPLMVKKLETEKKLLQDINQRMSIWPLIEAGEFSTISEGLTEADAALTQGKWADYITNLAEKIPEKLGTVGRYAAITRDTALFKGMSRAVQYGDFLAKATLYDHHIAKGKKPKDALKGVTEEFVNYNFLPGRTRSYADSMGLTWFTPFKLRSIKVARNHILNHPARALLLSLGNPVVPELPGVSLGSPIEDNLLTVLGEGRSGWVGPGMLFRVPELHPVIGLFH